MQFLRVEIYGFGKWVDTTLDFKEQSFISLYGENEAGKSTLQQFIMYILFGLPPRKLTIFKPRKSNKIGGKLTVFTETLGEYTIERTDNEVRCYLKAGVMEDEAWLIEQLNGLTREMYESIYTFSATDLEAIQKMDATQLSDVLFSVGLTGSTHIYELERQLDRELDQLFKRTGRKPTINQQITAVDNANQILQQHQAVEADYQTKVFAKENIQRELKINKETLTQLRQTKNKYEKIEHVLPSIEAYYATEASLNKLPKMLAFPKDGLQRYTEFTNLLMPLASKMTVLQNEIKSNEADIIKYRETLLRSAEQESITNLLLEKDKVAERSLQIKQYQDQISTLETEIKQKLIDIELAEQYIENLSLPFHLEQTWLEIVEKYQQMKVESESLLESEKLWKNELDSLLHKQNELKETLLSSDEINSMSIQVMQYENMSAQQSLQHQDQNILLMWQQRRKKTAKTVLFGSITLAAAMLIIGLISNISILPILSVFFVMIGIGQFYFLKYTSNELEEIASSTQNHAVNELSEAQYMELKERLMQQQSLQEQSSILHNDLEKMKHEQIKLEERKRLLYQKEAKYIVLQKQEIEMYPFLQTLEPAHWLQLLQIMRQTKELIVKKQATTVKLTDLNNMQQGVQTRMTEVAAMLQVSEDLINFSYLEKRLNNEMNTKKWITDLRSSNTTIEKEVLEIAEQMKIYEQEQTKLFHYAQVENKEAYITLAHQKEEHDKLTKEKERLVTQMKITFDQDTMEQIIAREINVQQLSFQIAEISQEIEIMDERIMELNKELVTIEMEINQLETSEDYSKASYTFQIEKDTLQEQSETWAVLKVMQTALTAAKKSYQEKYLTEVIRYTTIYFKQMTNQAYVQVYAPTEKKGFQVETSTMDRFTIEELSQGTVDQLYVSLRLAISKVMSDNYHVPLIIDDAFVHFDQYRMLQSIDILKGLAQEQQVILFTCRKSLAKQTNAHQIAKLNDAEKTFN